MLYAMMENKFSLSNLRSLVFTSLFMTQCWNKAILACFNFSSLLFKNSTVNVSCAQI